MASPSIRIGSNAWIERRWSVGARLSSTGCPLVTSSRMSHTSGDFFSIILRAPRTVCTKPSSFSRRMMNGSKSTSAIFFGQAALVELQLGADDDDGTARVVDALAEQILAEPALLALEHVAQGFQRAVAGAGHGPAMAAVVEERVDRLLQHPLFVVDDDVGRLELQQVLQAVVAVDDAAIEIVEIGGGEAAAFERDQRAQVRRDHRQHLEHHPLRAGPWNE